MCFYNLHNLSLHGRPFTSWTSRWISEIETIRNTKYFILYFMYSNQIAVSRHHTGFHDHNIPTPTSTPPPISGNIIIFCHTQYALRCLNMHKLLLAHSRVNKQVLCTLSIPVSTYINSWIFNKRLSEI